jgi:hypothetical protein
MRYFDIDHAAARNLRSERGVYPSASSGNSHDTSISLAAKQTATAKLNAEIEVIDRSVRTTFVKMHMESLASVKGVLVSDTTDCIFYVSFPFSAGVRTAWFSMRIAFADNFDPIGSYNAGVVSVPSAFAKTDIRNQFTINHLAHNMLIQEPLLVLTKTAESSGPDVRIVSLTLSGWAAHPRDDIKVSTLKTTQGRFMEYSQI